MFRVMMTMEHPKTKQTFTVDFDSFSYSHPVYDDDGFLGRIRMREFHKAGFECTCVVTSIG